MTDTMSRPEAPIDPYANAARALAVASIALPIGVFGVAALVASRKAERRIAGGHGEIGGKQRAQSARKLATVGVVLGVFVLLALLASASWTGIENVQKTFFNWTIIRESFPDVFQGFKHDVSLFMAAEALVLVWALLVAVLRSLPGPAAAPIRWLMIIYVDIFRGMPALLTIYLIGFGIPIAFELENASLFMMGVIALTLVYGAYVAEVYRAGIESVHWSQTAAARSLGLSYTQTMRSVIIPQAVRRVIPPLLNDFIGLQKDAALVSTIGFFEGFRQASIIAGNRFNPSPLVGLAVCFIAVTIPLARFTDYLIRRDQRRTQGGR